uniref:Uncharacterized protein n=1 Tax=Rhizophora mucronata TaxID=61149 RepID=A0A2P2LN56_RHIMU
MYCFNNFCKLKSKTLVDLPFLFLFCLFVCLVFHASTRLLACELRNIVSVFVLSIGI